MKFLALLRVFYKQKNFYKAFFFFIVGCILCGCRQQPTDDRLALLNDYSIFCLKKNLPNEARFYLEQAKKYKKHTCVILNNLGVVHEYMGDKVKAKDLYEQALNFADAQKNYIQLNLQNLLNKNGINNVYLRSPMVVPINFQTKQPPLVSLDSFDSLGINFKGTAAYTLKEAIKDYLEDNLELEVHELEEAVGCESVIQVEFLNYSRRVIPDYRIKSVYSKPLQRFIFYEEKFFHEHVDLSFELSFREYFRKTYTVSCAHILSAETYSPDDIISDKAIQTLIKEPLNDLLKLFIPEIIHSSRLLLRIFR